MDLHGTGVSNLCVGAVSVCVCVCVLNVLNRNMPSLCTE